MRHVLCFGDSNTWGYIPGTGNRYPRSIRWTGILQHELDGKVRIIEEGLSGRTTCLEDGVFPDMNGSAAIGQIVDAHAPIDLMVILLGTNDLKERFGATPADAAAGARSVVERGLARCTAHGGAAPKVLLIAPPPLVQPVGAASPEFQNALESSKEFGVEYKKIADALGTDFLDSAAFVRTSDKDGVHWDEEGHVALGRAVAVELKRILSLD